MNLKELRENSRYSITQVALLTNLNRQTIWNYETGKTSPTLESVIKLCKVYGISREKFIKCYEETINEIK